MFEAHPSGGITACCQQLGFEGAWQLCKACGRQCSSSLCVDYYSPCEVLLFGRLLWVIATLGSLLRDTRTEWEDYVVLIHRGFTPLCLFLFCGYVSSSWTTCVHKIFLPFCVVLRSVVLRQSCALKPCPNLFMQSVPKKKKKIIRLVSKQNIKIKILKELFTQK